MQGEPAAAFTELELDAGRGCGGAVLDRQREALGVAAEVEVAVAPGVQLGRAAERLAGAGVAALAGGWTRTTAQPRLRWISRR